MARMKTVTTFRAAPRFTRHIAIALAAALALAGAFAPVWTFTALALWGYDPARGMLRKRG